MNTDYSPRSLRRFFSEQTDLEICRTYYCYQIGSTFVNLAAFERDVIIALSICDGIFLQKQPLPRNYLDSYEYKSNFLEKSTLGSMISVLIKHGISSDDEAYLRWITEKRNHFVHRFITDGMLPGDTSVEEIQLICRQLLYLEHLFRRGRRRIWQILDNAGLMILHDLGDEGFLMMPRDLSPLP